MENHPPWSLQDCHLSRSTRWLRICCTQPVQSKSTVPIDDYIPEGKVSMITTAETTDVGSVVDIIHAPDLGAHWLAHIQCVVVTFGGVEGVICTAQISRLEATDTSVLLRHKRAQIIEVVSVLNGTWRGVSP